MRKQTKCTDKFKKLNKQELINISGGNEVYYYHAAQHPGFVPLGPNTKIGFGMGKGFRWEEL